MHGHCFHGRSWERPFPAVDLLCGYLCQNPNKILLDFNITIGDTSLEQVEHFPYLGSLLSKKCTSEKDVQHWIGAACRAFGKRTKHVFSNKDLNLTTKSMVYNAVAISTLLYSAKSRLYMVVISKNKNTFTNKSFIKSWRWNEITVTNTKVLDEPRVKALNHWSLNSIFNGQDM